MPVPSAMNTTVAAPEAAPNRRSARAAAFTSCSTTTGRPSRSVIRSATGASRHARCGANRTPRRSGVDETRQCQPDGADGVPLRELRDDPRDGGLERVLAARASRCGRCR